jgi:hypothetical protein
VNSKIHPRKKIIIHQCQFVKQILNLFFLLIPSPPYASKSIAMPNDFDEKIEIA